MDTRHLDSAAGERRDETSPTLHQGAGLAISQAIHSGYRIGRKVRIGHVPGRIIGYNIGNFGRYRGASYPLVVKTEYGIAKCSLREVCRF